MGDKNRRAPALTPEQKLAAQKAVILQRKALEEKHAAKIKKPNNKSDAVMAATRIPVEEIQCAACKRFGHDEKSGCFRNNEKALKAFIARRPDQKEKWDRIMMEEKNREAGRARAIEHRERVEAAKMAYLAREKKRNSICVKCSYSGHFAEECFRSNEAAREEYLKDHPAEREMWERRVHEYEWKEAHHAAPEKYWKYK